MIIDAHTQVREKVYWRNAVKLFNLDVSRRGR